MPDPATGKPTKPGPDAIRAARAAWRRDQIITAAVGLLERRSFHQMSVSDLAEEAGISVGTVYQYVESKEDVLVMVIVDILEAYRDAITPIMADVTDPAERLHRVFRAYCGVVNSRRSAVVLGYGASRALPPSGRRKVMELETLTTGLLAECVQAGVKAKVFEAASAELVAWDLAILAHMWALKHWHLSKAFSFEDYVEVQWRTVLRALVPTG
jgi:AcrR family transcriptional regulator